jgi:hypothetical protein
MTRVLALRVKAHAVIVHLEGDYSILGLQPERDLSGCFLEMRVFCWSHQCW